ncbi:MAG: hypothetical protein ACFFDW_09850 [Candidatus Thorarchaeota archaeon]
MSYSFDQGNEQFIDEEKENTNVSFPDLITDIIYCPKCGTENFPSITSGFVQNYFCSRCDIKLNDFWDGLKQGITTLVSCEQCNKSTFTECKFCINCGGKQKAVAKKQSAAISKEMPVSSNVVDEDVGMCCFQGLGALINPGILFPSSKYSRVQRISIGILFPLSIALIFFAIILHSSIASDFNTWMIIAISFDILGVFGLIFSIIIFSSANSRK